MALVPVLEGLQVASRGVPSLARGLHTMMRRANGPTGPLAFQVGVQNTGVLCAPLLSRSMSSDAKLDRESQIRVLSKQVQDEMARFKLELAAASEKRPADAPFSDYSMDAFLEAVPSATALANFLTTGFESLFSLPRQLFLNPELTVRDECQDPDTVRNEVVSRKTVKIAMSMAGSVRPPLLVETRTEFPNVKAGNKFQEAMSTSDEQFKGFVHRLKGTGHEAVLRETGVPILIIFGGKDPESSMRYAVDGVLRKAGILFSETGIPISMRTSAHAGPQYAMANARMPWETANSLCLDAHGRFSEGASNIYGVDTLPLPQMAYVSCSFGERNGEGVFHSDEVPTLLDNTVAFMRMGFQRFGDELVIAPSDTYGLGTPQAVHGLHERIVAEFGDDAPPTVQHWHMTSAGTMQKEVSRLSSMLLAGLSEGATDYQMAATLRGGSPFKMKGADVLGVDSNFPLVVGALQASRTQNLSVPGGDTERFLASSIVSSFYNPKPDLDIEKFMVALDQGVRPSLDLGPSSLDVVL